MVDEKKKPSWFGKFQPKKSSCCNVIIEEIDEKGEQPSCCSERLTIELLIIDLETCARCVPTNMQLKAAVKLLTPVATALGIELVERTTVVKTPEEALRRALLSSPTVRINGRDITQDVRESRCESCGDIAGGGAAIDCREWLYKGKVYSAAPLALLVEAIMKAMLDIDALYEVDPKPIEKLPESLERFFAGKRGESCCS